MGADRSGTPETGSARHRKLEEAKEALPPDLDLAGAKTSPQLYGLTKIAGESGGIRSVSEYRVTYFENGETFFPELRQLKKAKKFIFLEFFILAEGYMGGSAQYSRAESKGGGRGTTAL